MIIAYLKILYYVFFTYRSVDRFNFFQVIWYVSFPISFFIEWKHFFGMNFLIFCVSFTIYLIWNRIFFCSFSLLVCSWMSPWVSVSGFAKKLNILHSWFYPFIVSFFFFFFWGYLISFPLFHFFSNLLFFYLNARIIAWSFTTPLMFLYC